MSKGTDTLKGATEAKEESSHSLDQPNSPTRKRSRLEGLEEDTSPRLPTGTVVDKGVRPNQEEPTVAEVVGDECDDSHPFWELLKLAGYTTW